MNKATKCMETYWVNKILCTNPFCVQFISDKNHFCLYLLILISTDNFHHQQTTGKTDVKNRRTILMADLASFLAR
jgi:hypothetical protein